MTIVYQPSRSAALATADEQNNPIALWNNLATPTNISAPGGVVAGGPASNAVSGSTFDYVTPTVASGAFTVNVDLGSAQLVTSFAIASHNLGTLTAFLRVEFSADNSTWTDSGAGVVSATSDEAIMWRFSQTARYWRLNATNVSAGQPAIGVIFLGEELIIPQRIYVGYAPPITPNIVDLQSNVSEGGHLLGSRIVKRGSTAQANITHLTPGYVRSTAWKGLQNHFNNGRGFFWGWRPTGYPELYYAWREGATIAPENTGPQAFTNATLAMRFYSD